MSNGVSEEYKKAFPEMTHEQFHLHLVKTVLLRLNDWGLRVAIEKCSFLQSEVEFLGRKISQYGMLVSTKHVKKIQSVKIPQSKKAVERLLGMLGWHRFAVPNHANTVEPIQSVFRAEEFNWTEEATKALKAFKTVITEDLIVQWPQWDEPVYLLADASLYAFGSTLIQIKEIDINDPDWKKKLPTKKLSNSNKPILPLPGKNCPPIFNAHDPELVMETFDKLKLNMKVDVNAPRNIYHYVYHVAFYSKAFNSCQRRWGSLEREAACATESIQHFKPLLDGFKKVYVVLDSQPVSIKTFNKIFFEKRKIVKYCFSAIVSAQRLPIEQRQIIKMGPPHQGTYQHHILLRTLQRKKPCYSRLS